MEPTVVTITPEERTLAALTHLSGLWGYLIPLGGCVVPLIIWAVKSDSRVIASIAKQAVLLNLVVFVLIAGTALLWLTVVLIPAVILFWVVLGLRRDRAPDHRRDQGVRRNLLPLSGHRHHAARPDPLVGHRQERGNDRLPVLAAARRARRVRAVRGGRRDRPMCCCWRSIPRDSGRYPRSIRCPS